MMQLWQPLALFPKLTSNLVCFEVSHREEVWFILNEMLGYEIFIIILRNQLRCYLVALYLSGKWGILLFCDCDSPGLSFPELSARSCGHMKVKLMCRHLCELPLWWDTKTDYDTDNYYQVLLRRGVVFHTFSLALFCFSFTKLGA